MAGKLVKITPRASSKVHLIVSASIWTVVGLMLILRGVGWLNSIDRLWIILPALFVGSIKSFLILDRSAKKGIDRILASRHGKCIGGVYPVKIWLLVLVMMLSGILLRNSSLAKEVLGLLYVAIGWALLYSSRNAWRAWKYKTAVRPEPDDNKNS